MKYFVRNLTEYAVIAAVWWVLLTLIAHPPASRSWLVACVLVGAGAKSAFFGIENLQELWRASLRNLPYYHFLLLMLVNMSQIITSFALDFHCLLTLDPASFGSIPDSYSSIERLFECFYFSVLNFTFFGYGDVTPQTIPAKLLTMTEILLAFITVIFLLSDFISLKDSLAGPRQKPGKS